VGYGGPIPSEKPTAPPVGTHSQLFFVAISYGIPAAVFFMTWFGLTFLRAGRAVSGPRFWAHVALLVFLMETPYYLLEMHLVIAMIIAAFIWRDILRPPPTQPAAERPHRPATA
jgi:hypothetical protein